MSSRLIIALIIMLLAPGVQAHNFVTGKTVTPVYIQEGGELLLNSDDEIHYQKWNSTQLAGKVRIIQYIAGRKSAKKKNSLLIKAVEAANFPQDRFQPTTIVNTDDAIFGTGYFVVGKIEKNKRRYPWAQFVIDGNGQGRVAWRLPEESSTILVLNKAGQIQWAKDGSLTPEEVDHVIALAQKLFNEYLFKGFMPQLYEENIDITRFYRNYYMTYVERDARQLVNIRNFSSFEIFIKLLAGRVGQLVNLNSLSGDVGVSSTTLGEWLSILEASYIVFRLPPYFENFGKRLIKTPKLYFTEVGLAAYLLDLENPSMVARDPLMGNLFENMVVVEALKARYNAGKDAGLYFFRDSNGMEIDLLQSANRQLYPMEIKAARTYNSDFAVNIKKFGTLNDKTADGSIIYSGDNTQKIGDVQLLNFMDTASVIH